MREEGVGLLSTLREAPEHFSGFDSDVELIDNLAAREALKHDPKYAKPYQGLSAATLDFVLGVVLMQEGKNVEAAKSFRNYLQLAPDDPEAALIRQQLPKLEAATTKTE